jgi:hypothetical protein
MPASTVFEATLLSQYPNPGSRLRGMKAGAKYRLRAAYAAGGVDPGAHTLAKVHPDQLAALTSSGNLAAFDAITTA